VSHEQTSPILILVEGMNRALVPYSVPRKLSLALARVRGYWEGLKRGDASMPFWDDVDPAALPDLAGQLILMKVFERPWRFQFVMPGKDIEQRYGVDLKGAFSDEIDIRHPFEYFNSQCFFETRAPTYYRHVSADDSASRQAEGYSRLMLPMWGEGHVGMLLGIVAWD
jgi:hypothetical protein